jgi:nifR3 family TIM-barrel protein
MKSEFWKKFKKPIMANAPMSNVTDEAFRQMFVKSGKPDVFWTEFVSVEALLANKNNKRIIADLWFTKKEHPIVAQIFGSKPDEFEKAAEIICDLGFDGIDINMGCPDKSVEKQNAGAALIKNPELARAIIRATRKGAKKIPISVKTRIGYSKNEIKKWIPVLLKEDISALTVHLRTRNEMSKVKAHWELARSIVNLRDKYSPKTLILCNGDINSLAEAKEKSKKYKIDGVMVGRGIFGNPWFFSKKTPSQKEKLLRLIEHAELFEKLYKSNSKKKTDRIKNFDVMKKHFKSYVSDFNNAKELRMKLMETKNAKEVKKIIINFIKENL